MFYKNISKNAIRYFNLVKNISNWQLHLAIKFGLSSADPVLFKTRQGIFIEAPRALLAEFREIFMSECYTRGTRFSLGENPVVVDIGANVGFFSLYALSSLHATKVISYEPVPTNFRQLERNLRMNSGYNAVCFQKAVAGRSADLLLHYSGEGYTTAASICEGGRKNTETITIPAVSLAGVFEENGLEKCDLLKMDCEGAEFEIVYNCPREIMDRIGNIVMEVHNGEGRNNINSLEDYLGTLGFVTKRFPIHPGSPRLGMLMARRKAAE